MNTISTKRAEMLNRFKTLFQDQRRKLLYTKSVLNDEFLLAPEDCADEVDMSSSELESSMRMRLRNRETLFMKKIDESLARIADGTFGLCECCGDGIENRRLEARPTTTFCINCKEEQERLEQIHIDGHRPKSLGRQIRFA